MKKTEEVRNRNSCRAVMSHKCDILIGNKFEAHKSGRIIGSYHYFDDFWIELELMPHADAVTWLAATE